MLETETNIFAAETAVREATRAFAQALTETAEYETFEEASSRLRDDQLAQQAIAAYQSKQRSLEAMLMLNAVSVEDQAKLDRLQQAFLSESTVVAYFQAQDDLMALCQASADLLSERIGLSFAAACGPGCC